MFTKAIRLMLAITVATLGWGRSAQAQTFDYFAFFNGIDGDGPEKVIQGTDGNFYTVTAEGGALQDGDVVRITPTGEITSIYDFCSKAHCSDGSVPFSPPILGGDGNLYGVTYAGGSGLGNGSGWGTLYKMTLDGQITTLHTFCAYPCNDGTNPTGIVQAADGNLYGVTSSGGELNGGTLYRVTTSGEFKVVHSFCSLANCADGEWPISAPILGSDGNLYGTTSSGNQLNNSGAVYSLSPNGTFSVVHTFSYHNTFDKSLNQGESPNAVVQGAHGNLLGTTYNGGAYGWGNIFEITSTLQFRVLHNFAYGPQSGVTDAITFANDGNLYGTTGGIDAEGTMFEITGSGEYSTVQDFFAEGGIQGAYGFFQAPNGNLYGSVASYNHNYNGALFSFSNGFHPSIGTAPGGGEVGASILILGNNLTGTSSVKFNGVEAAFTVESDTYIQTTVPAGATTGVVSVATPSGTLNSNLQFVVTK